MDRVSIRLVGGRLEVRSGAKKLDVSRATVFFVAGNDYPVVLLDIEGTKVEFAVSSLDIGASDAEEEAPRRTAPR